MSHAVNDESPLGHVVASLRRRLDGYTRVRREYVETDCERERLMMASPCYLHVSHVNM